MCVGGRKTTCLRFSHDVLFVSSYKILLKVIAINTEIVVNHKATGIESCVCAYMYMYM